MFQIQKEAGPLVITGPSYRTGTTLIQRLLNSSSNVLIYGENLNHFFVDMTQMMLSLFQFYKPKSDHFEGELKRVLDGDVNFWSPHLMPSIQGYLEQWQTFYVNVLRFLQEDSTNKGRPLWGFKHPQMTRDQLLNLQRVIKNVRVIFIYRSINEVVASAKSRQFIKSEKDLIQLCQNWTKNMHDMMTDHALPQLLRINYHQLLSETHVQLEKIKQFSGANRIETNVMKVKVNTWKGSNDPGSAPKEYIPPSEITNQEQQIIQKIAGETMLRYF